MAKKSKAAKVFIYLTLAFIVFASFAAYIVMYAWITNSNKSTCPEWYQLNEDTQKCEEINETNKETEIDNEESCTEAWWTWYVENNICILPDAQ